MSYIPSFLPRKIHFYYLLIFLALATATSEASEYVGSQACNSCHIEQFRKWTESHHSWAWRPPTPENVLGDFGDVTFEHGQFTYLFSAEGSKYFVVEIDDAGKAVRYPVHSVAGVAPLQQYLIDIGKGKLQALDVAWDVVHRRWYHLYPSQKVSTNNGMHWTGSYKNWNARCAECHATAYEKNYRPLSDSYDSRQAEIGVGCEACHGPGKAHVSWAKAPEKRHGNGLISTYSKDRASSEINLCAGCHSRREPIGANSPTPGEKYDGHYNLALLRNGLYFPDGQINDEVYVYGSFLQSKMHEKGVTCTNCHDAHSYKLKLQGNALCVQCHNPQGNVHFPSLTKKQYDSSSHHFHAANSPGAQCVECHMPQRSYMVVDGRRDHSFRIPRPDISRVLGTPNPCNVCHSDQDAQWAAAEIKKRYSNGRTTQTHFSQVFNAADQHLNDQVVQQLLELADKPLLPAIVRASALDRLLPIANSVELDRLEHLLVDDNAWIRGAAANLLTQDPDRKKQDRLRRLLEDPSKSVRLIAVKSFIGERKIKHYSPAEILSIQKVWKEYQQSLLDKADFPEIQMVIGGVALTMRNIPIAVGAFNQAIRMDPQLVDAWLMLYKIYAATNQVLESREVLTDALKNNPGNKTLLMLQNSF